MMKILSLLALFGSAVAFAPAGQTKVSTAMDLTLDDLPGVMPPTGKFDPMGLAETGSDATLLWFRAAELKHSRVAMLACTGYLVNGAGYHFGGMLSKDVSFESLSSMKPFDAWDAVPESGKAQILFTIFLAEVITESKGTHYTKGGDFPQIVFPPVDFSSVDAKTLEKRQMAELANGRLAMIGIMSFIAAVNVPGSVPALVGNPAF
mmetsp:Transcript_36774/g.56502  ORF Transcript_36774/g.56502 Transcript_36774/m.56502 type:complete len:206 (+) Transcript_36774:111-728(+)|eukprot:CAMPEP_0118674998 /NCGR_PEP_ID=MMETSP0800-20121206/1199_1 /TAXON_ID=210618 ORGANISM="Striatella unipunctata, Strain CCMP2910" /NCGR_SAMPLE_ID=MMETSP0800 /ASSEMBLY_ACC=CAM_ASM_000638 /LENGTH=205 /DNA_ID=CAMNT_0006570255 /DNA_START=214 /DNA_END=831 /DNA_ORIENTATION=+